MRLEAEADSGGPPSWDRRHSQENAPRGVGVSEARTWLSNPDTKSDTETNADTVTVTDTDNGLRRLRLHPTLTLTLILTVGEGPECISRRES